MTYTTGTEKYRVTDLNTGGEAYFEDKSEAHAHIAVVFLVLNHNYRLEVQG